MPRAELGLQSFDPQTLSILYTVFDHVVAELDADINNVNRHRIHTAVAKGIILLAGAGQLDPIQLKLYAIAQGRSAIF
jgi:hypothetical protein